MLDIGAGRTWSSRYLATLGRANEVIALDVLTCRFLGLETADLYFQQDQIFFERIRGDVHHLPILDGWANVVFSCATVHHSSDLALLFREIWRVLAPGGSFVFISEPCKRASIPEHQPQNEETAHGINEHIYSYSEYFEALRAAGFRCRTIAPRSIRYRLMYPDKIFSEDIPPFFRWISESERGRRLLQWFARGRRLPALLYRYWSLPLSGIAVKPG